MRVTALDLMMTGWHYGFTKNGARWAFRRNPDEDSLKFYQAVKAYKAGMRDTELHEIKIYTKNVHSKADGL